MHRKAIVFAALLLLLPMVAGEETVSVNLTAEKTEYELGERMKVHLVVDNKYNQDIGGTLLLQRKIEENKYRSIKPLEYFSTCGCGGGDPLAGDIDKDYSYKPEEEGTYLFKANFQGKTDSISIDVLNPEENETENQTKEECTYICQDSDGTDTTIKGEVDIIGQGGCEDQRIVKEDKCHNETTLIEQKCQENKRVEKQIACEKGRCVSGICVTTTTTSTTTSTTSTSTTTSSSTTLEDTEYGIKEGGIGPLGFYIFVLIIIVAAIGLLGALYYKKAE